jgi:glucose-1-phosphate adenylyltransferase
VTIAATPMLAADVQGLGVLRVNDDLRVTRFAEKPTDPEQIARLAVSERVMARLREARDGKICLVNMGIYVFDKQTLWAALADPTLRDFSKEVLPGLLADKLTKAFLYEGYWRDIGTVRAFFEANLDLANADPPFDLFTQEFVVYTHPRFLPASRLHRCTIDRAMVADGCRIVDAELTRCVVGVRSRIEAGTSLRNVVMMGQDRFESEHAARHARLAGLPPFGIGRDCVIHEAIIDKNARIGDGVRLSPGGLPDGFTQGDVSVRDGVLVVTKNGVVASGTVLGER